MGLIGRLALIGAACLVLLLFTGTLLAEAHFQIEWRSELVRSAQEVTRFYSVHGRLPVDLQEAFEDPNRLSHGMEILSSGGKKARTIDLLQFRPLAKNGFQIWLTRTDLHAL